jgi:hypothetical protein
VESAGTNRDGDCETILTPGDYSINISAEGFVPDLLPAHIGLPGTITHALKMAGGILPRLVRNGRDLFTEHGDRHIIVGTTELLLAWRYDREGPEAIREVCEQRRACGFNNVRVLWQKDIGNTGHSPWQMPTAKLRPFLGFMESFGFYVQGTILADCPVVNPNEADQQARVSAVRSATVGVSNLIEQLGNEYDKNGHDPHHFSKPSDRLSANSSSTEGREYGPVEFIYGDGSWGGVPAICDEGMKPGINSSDPRDFERAGAQARSGCGGRFHTDAGTAGNSRLFNDLELACAQAFVKGLR